MGRRRSKVGKGYREMSEGYRDKKDKDTFQNERSNQRKAGKWLDRFDGDIDAARRQVFKKTTNLEDFDLGLTGAGGAFSPTREVDGKTRKGFEMVDGEVTAFGKGVDRLSRYDARNLMKYANNWSGENEDGSQKSKLEAAYMLRDHMNKIGERTGPNDRDGFVGTGAFSYINKKIGELETAAGAPSTTQLPTVGSEDPVDAAPEPIDTAPGTGPGIDGGVSVGTGGTGGGGNNKASTGGAIATGGGSSAAGGNNKIGIDTGGGDIFGDVIGSQSIVKNFGAGMSGSAGGNGYGSALGSSEAYIDAAEDRFNENSGRDYYLGTSAMGVNRALANEYIDPVELSTGISNRAMALFGLGQLQATGLYGQYQAPTPFKFDDIDPEDDTEENLDMLKGMSDD